MKVREGAGSALHVADGCDRAPEPKGPKFEEVDQEPPERRRFTPKPTLAVGYQ